MIGKWSYVIITVIRSYTLPDSEEKVFCLGSITQARLMEPWKGIFKTFKSLSWGAFVIKVELIYHFISCFWRFFLKTDQKRYSSQNRSWAKVMKKENIWETCFFGNTLFGIRVNFEFNRQMGCTNTALLVVGTCYSALL